MPILAATCATLMLLAGCKPSTQVPAPPASSPSPPTVSPSASASSMLPAQWLGRWQGPEGTYLEIAPQADGYRVTIKDLDAARTFPAVATDRQLSFDRDGQRQTIRPGTGVDTGMKWLAEKKDCLVVKAGEGYCRD